MNPAQYREARALFHRLVERSDDERRRALDAADADTTVVECVRRMLGRDPQSDVFSDERLGEFGPELLRDDTLVGALVDLERIGTYRVLERIGEGGMGVVHRALDEAAPDGEPVAVKVLHAGLASARVVRRFRREALVLSRLDHPGIARYVDAGTAEAVTRGGGAGTVHFLAMEFVPGDSLVRHATRHGLDERMRLELMARVCDAVQAAHDLGVVHRDLKPGNVLVAPLAGDPVGRPKVLDFGVARHTGEDEPLTRTGAVLGTVPYMSPEQVSGGERAVSFASDVYALGVLAFELLTGDLPYPVRGLPLPEAARVVQEMPPRRLARGALDVVLGKALEKDAVDRYASAAALADDLRALRDGRPVAARPPAWTVRSRRFVARNRTLTASVAGVVLALVVGIVVATHAALRESELRASAEANAERSRLAAEEAGRAAHVARLQNAAAALDANDLAHAQRVLEACEPARRDWPWRLLRSRLDDSVLRAHVPDLQRGSTVGLVPGATDDELFVVSVSPDDAHRAAIHRWDLHSGRLVRVRIWDGVRGAALAEGGRELSWIGLDGVWTREDLVSGDVLARATEVADDADRLLPAVGLTTPGDPVVFKSGASGLLSWDGRADAPPAASFVGERTVTDDARRWIVTEPGGSVERVDVLTGETRTWPQAGIPIAVGPDGLVAVQMPDTSRVALCRPASGGGDVERTMLQLEHGEPLARVVFDVHAERCLTLGGTGSLRVWSTETGAALLDLRGGAMPARSALFLEDDQLAVLDQDGGLRLWDLRAPPGRILPLTAQVRGVAAVGDRVVFCTSGGRLGSIDLRDRKLCALVGAPLDAPQLFQIAVTPDGRRLVVTMDGGPARTRDVCVVDLANGTSRVLPADGGERIGDMGLAWSPDGRRLAVQDEQHGLEVFAWDADAPPERVASCDASGGGVRGAVAFSLDGRRLAARLGARRVGLLDPGTLQLVRELPCEDAIVTVLAWSPDGTRVAGGFRDDVVRVWSADDGTLVHTLRGHARTVVGLAWSPDGALLASGSMDTSVRLWDAVHGEELLRLTDERSPYRSLVFARDGECLVGETEIGLWAWDSADATEHRPARDVAPPSDDLRDLVPRPAPR
ncbi:MAG: protein kinase [Planctomycetes bacterium]|nr:protein kinase [Planctomycetota bacterium]